MGDLSLDHKDMNIIIREFHADDTIEVAQIIFDTYAKFNKNEFFDPSSSEAYMNHYNPKLNLEITLLATLTNTDYSYVAVTEFWDIAWIIRWDYGKIINLFVKWQYHRKGVGRLLLQEAEKENQRNNTYKIKIYSSLYAVGFYQELWYRKTTGVRNSRWLKIIPMKKDLAKS